MTSSASGCAVFALRALTMVGASAPGSSTPRCVR
jgi:hypothetical protein